nr:PAS domain-containing sensor histidine kinase [Proteocatella sp.]
VTDRGRGISEEDIPRVFERFYRADKSRTRKEKGTGLGLAIVKHLTKSVGGEIDLQSRLGEGTTFKVILPVTCDKGE